MAWVQLGPLQSFSAEAQQEQQLRRSKATDAPEEAVGSTYLPSTTWRPLHEAAFC